jgi:protein-tyrosine phosphatase
MYRVLFVCMGNICRSPTAEGVFTRLVRERAPDFEIEVDSAGTHAYHVGEPPDRRATLAAARRGIDLSSQRARAVLESDFSRFDSILAMDRDNRDILLERCTVPYQGRIRLFLEFARNAGTMQEVPDPYYGGPLGFERVLDLVEDAAEGLLEDLLARSAGQRRLG